MHISEQTDLMISLPLASGRLAGDGSAVIGALVRKFVADISAIISPQPTRNARVRVARPGFLNRRASASGR